MKKYKSKPTTIMAEKFVKDGPLQNGVRLNDMGYYVTTLQGQNVKLTDGDWIISEGVEGRYYPCSDEVFKAKYEEVK